MAMQPIYKFDFQSERTFDEKFEQLVKDWNNDEVKCILENSLNNVDWKHEADIDGMALLHLAVKHNNSELINFLVESGCNVDHKNTHGQTLLYTALCSDHLESIYALINAKANIWMNDAECVLKLLISKQNCLNQSTLISFMRQYKYHIEDLESMIELLIKVHCPLIFVVYMSDVSLTKTMLQTENYKISRAQGFAALMHTMQTSDLDNLQVLWRCERLTQSRNYLLRRIIIWTTDVTSVNWECMKPAFIRLTDWIVFDNNFRLFLKLFFSLANTALLHLFLSQCNVDVQIRQAYKLDVLPLLFGNENLNRNDLMELACKRQFDVNAKTINGLTALHISTKIGLQDNTRLLLELGANCNIKDDKGCTPLCHVVKDDKCVELLLHNGADLHIADNNGMTVIEKMKDFEGPWHIILAQLAIDHHRGIRIQEKILDKIRSTIFQKHYENCLKQVEELTKLEIFPSLMAFNIMTKKAKFLARLVQNRQIINMILEQCSRSSLHSYYYSLLQLNLVRAYNIHLTKYGFAQIISRKVSNPINFHHIVIDKICDFLSYNDMFIFAYSLCK